MSFATRTRRPPRTLTDDEQARLLKVSGEHRAGFRDHVLFSMALGCALRESELAALTIGDVSNDGRTPKRTIHLRVFKRAGKNPDPEAQRVSLPESTFYKLEKYLRSMGAIHLPAEAPLFPARGFRRPRPISTRRIRELFQEWQVRAGFDRAYNFHSLRHTAITAVRRKTGDIRVAQRVARHANISTTVRYDHVSDQEVADAVKDLKT